MTGCFRLPAIATALFAICTLGLSAQDASTEQKAAHYAEEGQSALAAGHLDVAQKNFEELSRIEPNVAEVHATLGRIYYEERRFADAVGELRTALKLRPTLPRVRTLLAISLSEMSEYRDALPDLDKCFHQSSDATEKQMCGLQLERTYNGLKMDQKAVEVALEMDRLYPDDPEVLYHSAQIYGNQAFQTLHQMSVIAPNSPWRYLAAAEIAESQGDLKAALDQYRQVLVLDPNRPGIHYRIGRTLLARARQTGSDQDQADALKEFLAELQVDPANANAAYEAGEISRNASHLDEAQKYFQMAVENYPRFDDAWIGLGTVYLAQEKPQQAAAALQKATSIDPSNEVSWYRLAQAERALGNTAEQSHALAEFKKVHQERAKSTVIGGDTRSEITRQTLDNTAQP